MRAPLVGVLLAAFLVGTPAADDAAARHSVTHWDFESEGDLSGWRLTYGGLSWAPGSGANGSGGAALSSDSAVHPARASHRVPVTPGGSYRLRGLLVSSEGEFDWAQLGVVLFTADGRVRDASSAGQLYLPAQWSTGFVAPCDAARGEVEITSRGAAGGRAYVDDIRLELIAPPASPCPAPTPTPTAPRPATAPPDTNAPPPIEAPAPDAGPPPLEPSTAALPRSGLLVNGGFEAAEEGRPLGWRAYGGVLTQVSAPARSGRQAGAFSSATASTKWVYQVVPVTSGSWYQLDGYVYHDDPRVEAALLRVSWYASVDGSGRALASVDSTTALEQPEARYRYLTTGPAHTPPGARSARARVLLRPRSAAGAVIYIDDVSFRPTAPALVAAAEPESQETTQARAGSSGRGSSSGLGLSYRGEALRSTPLPTPVVVRSSRLRAQDASTADASAPWWPWAVVGAGGVVAGVSGVGAWWRRKRGSATVG